MCVYCEWVAWVGRLAQLEGCMAYTGIYDVVVLQVVWFGALFVCPMFIMGWMGWIMLIYIYMYMYIFIGNKLSMFSQKKYNIVSMKYISFQHCLNIHQFV